MQEALTSLQERLAPAEEIFFTWLTRVFAVVAIFVERVAIFVVGGQG
jgi:hypothetical protein